MFKHRILEIDWNNSNMTLQMSLKGEKYVVEGDALACSVLLLFNRHLCYELKELNSHINIDEKMMEATLHGLLKSKLVISDRSSLLFNENYQGKKHIVIKK